MLADLQIAVGHLTKQLERVTARSHSHSVSDAAGPAADAESDVRLVRHLVAGRRSRDTILPAELLGEPAWDILLDLYLAEAEGRQSYSTSCCLASAAPQTTALRYIKRLATLGLVAEEPDQRDSRRTLIGLTDAGRNALDQWLRQWRQSRWF
jgi:DNA-binding MarR family transcriptional regulator